jgi:hypothetical protein
MAIIGGFDVHRAQITFDYVEPRTLSHTGHAGISGSSSRSRNANRMAGPYRTRNSLGIEGHEDAVDALTPIRRRSAHVLGK